MDCSLPGSPIHGIFQERVLEWGVIAFSGNNSPSFFLKRPMSLTQVIIHCGKENTLTTQTLCPVDVKMSGTQRPKALLWFPDRSDQIRSVAQSCPTLCDPMNRSMPGLPVHHQLPEFTQTHVHRVSDAIQPSSVVPFYSCPQSLPASESFPMSQLFA